MCRWRENTAGFTTVELVVACAVLLALTGAVAAVTAPVRHAVERSITASDLSGGLRLTLERLASEVREAGSAASVRIDRIRLGTVLPAIVPLADLDSSLSSTPATAIRLTRIARLAAQGVLQVRADIGTPWLQLEPTAPCSAVGAGCGLRRGVQALLHDESRALVVDIAAVADGGVVQLAAPLTTAFESGAVIAALTTTAYGIRTDPDGSFRLVRVTPDSEQPVLQSVVGFEVRVAGPDPFDVRRVDFTIRVEAQSAAMRGPAGPLFRRPGSSRYVAQWVPDIQLRMSVAPHNLTE